MLDFIFRLSLLLLIIAGTFFLFTSIDVPLELEQPGEVSESTQFASYSVIVFLVVTWLSFLLFVTFRQTLLLGLVLGQGTLYLIAPSYRVFTYEIPYYALMAGNGLYVLILYLFFTARKWKSGSLEGAAEEYERID